VRALSAYCLERTDIRGLAVGYGYASLASIQRYGAVLRERIATALNR